jgi:hypothetical protein
VYGISKAIRSDPSTSAGLSSLQNDVRIVSDDDDQFFDELSYLHPPARNDAGLGVNIHNMAP